MIPLFISMAVGELRTLLSIATPNSVKAKGAYFMLDPLPLFKITICDLEISSLVSSNMKSSPSKRAELRLTACLSTLVSILYSSARSKSNITFCPLISYILLCIICKLAIITLMLFYTNVGKNENSLLFWLIYWLYKKQPAITFCVLAGYVIKW